MAEFCLATKVSPSEYRKLKLVEVNAFVEALEDRGSSSDLEDLL
jgi:hypothetical protein